MWDVESFVRHLALQVAARVVPTLALLGLLLWLASCAHTVCGRWERIGQQGDQTVCAGHRAAWGGLARCVSVVDAAGRTLSEVCEPSR